MSKKPGPDANKEKVQAETQDEKQSEYVDHTKEELDRICYPVFHQLMTELGARYKDWIVMIEPQTKEYFLGQDDHEILSRACKKYPKGKFFGYRLSESPAVDEL
jgi:hypothetical protein